jgi:hypothetical protein
VIYINRTGKDDQISPLSPFSDIEKTEGAWEFEGETGIGAFWHEKCFLKTAQFAAAT